MRARVSLALVISGVTLLACHEATHTAPVNEAIASASLTFPPANPQRAIPPAERAFEDAARLESQDPVGAAKVAEKAIADFPRDPRVPELHLLAGRCRLAHEQALATMTSATSAEIEAYRESIASEATANPKQYTYSHATRGWVYNGWHFRQVSGREELEEAAAWQLTRLTPARECNGWLPCYVARDVEPVLQFLAKHPRSRYASEAVDRANAAFEGNLFSRGREGESIPIVNLRLRTDAYNPGEVRAFLDEYAAVAAKLDPTARAHAAETIGDLWTRFGEIDRARDAYDFIIRNVPDYVNLDDVGRKRRRLS